MGNCCSKPSSSTSAPSTPEPPIPLTNITIPQRPRPLRALSQLYPDHMRVELPDDAVGVDLGRMSMRQRQERVRAAVERMRESGAMVEEEGAGAGEAGGAAVGGGEGAGVEGRKKRWWCGCCCFGRQ